MMISHIICTNMGCGMQKKKQGLETRSLTNLEILLLLQQIIKSQQATSLRLKKKSMQNQWLQAKWKVCKSVLDKRGIKEWK